MADHMAAEIWIGGKMNASLVSEFCNAISEQCVSLEWGGSHFQPSVTADLMDHRRELGNAQVLWLCDDQARWGEIAALEAFLQKHNVPFTRQTDGKYEYDPEVLEFRPGREPTSSTTNKSGEPVIPISTLTELAKGLDAALSTATRAEMARQIWDARRFLESCLPPALPALESFEVITQESSP